MLKTLSSSIFILVFILFLEILFVSIYTLSVPNQLVFTALDNFNFYSNLLSVNPAMAIEIAFIGNPVFIVQRLDQLQGNQIWGVYFMPVNILVLFLLSLYISIVKKSRDDTITVDMDFVSGINFIVFDVLFAHSNLLYIWPNMVTRHMAVFTS